MNTNNEGRSSPERPYQTKPCHKRNDYPASTPINQALLPQWNEIFRRLNLPEPRRGRTKCPIHGGDSPQSLSVNDTTGRFKCFVCGASGDRIDFIRSYLKCDFNGALVFFGLRPGKTPKPDPGVERENAALRGFNVLCRKASRELNKLLFELNQILNAAWKRLVINPDDAIGLSLFTMVVRDYTPLETLQEALLSKEIPDRIAAFREVRKRGLC